MIIGNKNSKPPQQGGFFCALNYNHNRFWVLILLHFTTLLSIFALLIEKDGGIRPCDVLATCYLDKVLNSTQVKTTWDR
jgi:hypothetical protein